MLMSNVQEIGRKADYDSVQKGFSILFLSYAIERQGKGKN